MRRAFILVPAGLLGLGLVTLGAGAAWAYSRANAILTTPVPLHRVEINLPEPTAPAAPDTVDADADAPVPAGPTPYEASLERGQHLLAARYPCTECHGPDLAGAAMIDDPLLGSFYGPNLTGGAGSRVGGFTTADWDAIVRHGVLPGGTPGLMPSQDFFAMSDQELADIIVAIRALPPIDREMPPQRVGPLGKVLLATGALPLAASRFPDHFAEHQLTPPEPSDRLAFGEHLAQVCVGCHNDALSGGPVVGGDPNWPDASNLTPHDEGLAGWTFEGFETAMRTGVKPDGSRFVPPMNVIPDFAQHMTPEEMDALWAFLATLEPQPTPR